ncbi:MAG TPA: hypothetical protein VL523_03260 [Terriglobia bacterium]|nr:hypothetical protein [Terriglobia bacterium]
MSLIPDGVGWTATAVFAASYFCKGSGRLRAVQAGAAVVWIAYGALIRSFPVIASNVLVSSLALYSAWRGARNAPQTDAAVIPQKNLRPEI